MKIEIDFSKPEALQQMKRELEAALAAIEGAIKALPSTEAKQQQAIFPTSPPSQPQHVSRHEGGTILSLVGQEFTSRDLFAAGRGSGVSVAILRKLLRQQVESGHLLLVKVGQGRSPSVYRKAA